MTTRTLRACTVCGTPCTGPRCTKHGGNRHTLTTTQRGYGSTHQHTRKQLLATAIGYICPLCGKPMLAGQPLDLDHTIRLIDNPHSRGDRIVHANCNRGGRLHRGQHGD